MQQLLASFRSDAVNADLLVLTVGAFEPILDGIPDEDLWPCYIYAMRYRELHGVFTPTDIWWAWERIQEKRETDPTFYGETAAHRRRREQLREEEERDRIARENCRRCFASGFEIVPGKGARQCKHLPAEVVDLSIAKGVTRDTP
jgi:hypothetical protein